MWAAWERGVPIATENLVGYFVCAGRNAVIDLLRGQRSHSHRYVLGDEDSVTDDRAAPEDPDLRIDLVRWERAIPPRLRRFVRWRLDGIGAAEVKSPAAIQAIVDAIAALESYGDIRQFTALL